MSNSELTLLVEKSKKGETGAMEELLRVAYTPVSYQCRKFLRTGQDAEDMTQEILLLIYTKLDTLQEPAAFWGWLGRMTANRCKNVLSRTHTDLPILEDEDGNSVLDSIESEDRQLVPDEAFDNAETARMIEEIVDALPDVQRECVLLYYYDEMSVKEIADVAGVSENTVKSRLNYARRTIKESVLDYEKKNGIRLHSIAPLPLLLYFLRMAAEESTDSAAAQAMVGKIMAKGAVIMENASGSVAMASAKTAENTATAATKVISVKAAVGIAVGFFAVGGVTMGIVTALSNNKIESVESSAIVEEYDSQTEDEVERAEEEVIEEEEIVETEEAVFSETLLSSLPYTGDVDECVMSVSQAEAFAEVLEECTQKSKEAGYSQPPFCRAALFDAGDGIPALFVVWGYDMEYADYESGCMPNISQIYCWNGERAQVAYESSANGEYIFEEDISNIAVTDNGLLVNKCTFDEGMYADISELYTLEGGYVSEEPIHVFEEFAFADSSIPGLGKTASYITEHGTYGEVYDYDTLLEGKWHNYLYESEGARWACNDEGWFVATLDGNFLMTDGIDAARQTMAWYKTAWKLGHGTVRYFDVSHYWTGAWMDAEALAVLLSSGSES